jgi:thiamine kinase-like enzyme
MGPLVDRVFTQGDGNLGNFIWDGERCYVVDFEDSGVSDPAYEVADLVEHVSIWLAGLLDPDDLIGRLGLEAAQRHRLLEFRRLMALFWLLMLMPGNPGHNRNPEGSLERQAQRMHDLLGASVG